MDRPQGQGGLAGRALVVYDGGCRLCRAFAWALARLDRRGRLRILPFGDPVAEAAIAGLPPAARHGAVHLAGPAGVRSGAAAVDGILRALPGGTPLARAGLPRCYGPVARNRGRLGRLVPPLPVTRAT